MSFMGVPGREAQNDIAQGISDEDVTFGRIAQRREHDIPRGEPFGHHQQAGVIGGARKPAVRAHRRGR